MARVLVCAALLLLALAAAGAKAEAPQDLSLMEVGSATSISASAAAPLREVAALLVEARRSIGQMAQSRQPYNVISNTIKVRRHARPAAVQTAKPAESVNAELVPRMRQPRIHDAQKYGTRNPLDMGGNAAKAQWVDADIVGEDGKPFAPRKQWGVEADKNERELSPFAKYVQPPAVGSAADVEPKDPNTKLTPLELKRVTSLQLRLKQVLDQLGANVVWDHSKVRNRRLLNEFDELQKESRALMEEYEIRTGVKTIAWQLAPPDQKGLETPLGRVTDIHFAKHPELAGRLLQRGFQSGPPPPTDAMKRRAQQEEEEKLGLRPKKQTVGVAWKRQANGLVKTKVSLEVVGSKGPLPTTPPQMAAKPTVPGVHYPSGKKGSDSLPVQIDVVAPAGEKLKRNMNIAAPTSPEDQKAAEDDAAAIQKGIDKQADAKPLKPAKKPEPKINL